MPEKKYSGRITLRMKPDIHKRLAVSADKLGLDLTTILNVIVREALPRLEEKAKTGTIL